MLNTPLLKAFGLESLLTPQDDAQLWEAALRAYWQPPTDPACLVDALRFDVGRRLAEGEQPQGETNERHATMRGMVDIEEWCFERVDAAQLRVKTCPQQAAPPAGLYLGMNLMATMSSPAPVVPVQVVFIYLGITRPSQGVDQAVVFTGTTAPGLGDGKALLWQRQPDGSWQPTDQRVAWWIS